MTIEISGLTLDKNYIESKSQWQELTDRVARWMGRDSVSESQKRT